MIIGDSDSLSSFNSKPDESSKRHSIFRERAFKSYLEGREREVLPQFVSPISFLFLWILFALLIGSIAAGAYFIQIPLYASGPAAVVKNEVGKGSAVAAFFPREYAEKLQASGKRELLVQLGPDGERRSLPVRSVTPELVSSREANERFDLQDTERKAITGPTVVAVAPLKELPQSLDESSYSGKVYQAEVKVGSRRTITFIPIAGEWTRKSENE